MSQVGPTTMFDAGRTGEKPPTGKRTSEFGTAGGSADAIPVFADLISTDKRPVVAALDMDATSVAAPDRGAETTTSDVRDRRLQQMNAEANAQRKAQRRGLAANGRAEGVREADAQAARLAPSTDRSRPGEAPVDSGLTQVATGQAGVTGTAPAANASVRRSHTQPPPNVSGGLREDGAGIGGGAARGVSTTAGLHAERPEPPTDSLRAGQVAARAQSAQATPAPQTPRAGEVGSGVTTNAAEHVGKMLGAKAEAPQAGRTMEIQPVVGERGDSQTRGAQPALRGIKKEETSPESKQANARSETQRSTGRSEFERLFESIRVRGGQDRSTARMRLQPPELGRIQIDVRLDGDRLDLRIEAESRGAEDALRARIGHLRDAFAEHGIHLGRTEIVTADGDAMTESADGRGAAFSADGQSMREASDSDERRQGSAATDSAGGQPADAWIDDTVELEHVIALDGLLESYSVLDVVA